MPQNGKRTQHNIFLITIIGIALFFAGIWWGLRSWVPSTPKPQKTILKEEFPQKTQVKTIQPRPLTQLTRKAAPPKKRKKKEEEKWVGKPPKLPPHEVFLQRIRNRYKTDAPPPPKPSSKFYVLKRSEFKKWLELPLAQCGARFMPEFTGGRPNGIRVRSVEPGSFYARLGLYKNDVLLKVNGRPVYSPGHAHKYYKIIAKRYRNLTLEFRRGREVYIRDFSLR